MGSAMLQPLRFANSSRAASPFEILMVVSCSPCDDQYAMGPPPAGQFEAASEHDIGATARNTSYKLHATRSVMMPPMLKPVARMRLSSRQSSSSNFASS